MIIFNDKKYALNQSEFNNSLFERGGTCNGFYKIRAHGVLLFNMQNELIAFVRTIKEPMLMSATIRNDGQIWYSYTMECTENYLGFNDVGIHQQFNTVRDFAYDFEQKRG